MPSIKMRNFVCPHCSVTSNHTWYRFGATEVDRDSPYDFLESIILHENAKYGASMLGTPENVLSKKPNIKKQEQNCKFTLMNVWSSECNACSSISLWWQDKMIYPLSGSVPFPHADTPSAVHDIYLEARGLFNLSHRASAAILRVALEKLLVLLNLKENDINKNIGKLVSLGIDEKTQQSLDIIRIMGNNAAHAGQINLEETKDNTYKLFLVFNIIIEKVITQKNMIDELYSKMPKEKIDGIKRRDKKSGA